MLRCRACSWHLLEARATAGTKKARQNLAMSSLTPSDAWGPPENRRLGGTKEWAEGWRNRTPKGRISETKVFKKETIRQGSPEIKEMQILKNCLSASSMAHWVENLPAMQEIQEIQVWSLPGKSLGQRSLVGYSLWHCKESDMTEQLTH